MKSKAALASARPEPLWLDDPIRPEPTAPLSGSHSADLVVVGGGYTGLWAALQMLEREPSRSVVLIEADRIGGAASGRNGGFCSASLTHGIENGVSRFPSELARLETLGAENFAGIRDTIAQYNIEADWSEQPTLAVATAPWLVPSLAESRDLEASFGHEVVLLDRDQTRAEVDSPTYFGALEKRDGEATVNPARLAWGLADAVRSLGGQIYEGTPMTAIERSGAGLLVRTTQGSIRAGAVILGTNAFRSPIGAINRRVVPVYDYVLATEPLSPGRLASIGWSRRQGISDTTNQFHYYRLTADNRILWGGYDAIYHFGSKIDPRFDQSADTHDLLARHFYETFPQLDDVTFTHRWGGVIDTSTRFAVSFGTEFDGRLAYAIGYTGLGVASTRFGAAVCCDLLFRPDSPLLDLDFVRKRALPFPPEPIRWAGIELTRREIARADRNKGKRGPWLRLLDAVGLGFDS